MTDQMTDCAEGREVAESEAVQTNCERRVPEAELQTLRGLVGRETGRLEVRLDDGSIQDLDESADANSDGENLALDLDNPNAGEDVPPPQGPTQAGGDGSPDAPLPPGPPAPPLPPVQRKETIHGRILAILNQTAMIVEDGRSRVTHKLSFPQALENEIIAAICHRQRMVIAFTSPEMRIESMAPDMLGKLAGPCWRRGTTGRCDDCPQARGK